MSLLDDLKAAHKAATPGPWKQERDWGPDLSARISALGETLIYDEGGHSSEDAELIVLTRNALPEIIAALEERERLRAVVEDIRNVRHAMTGLPGAVFTAPEYDEIIRDVMRDIDRTLDALEGK